MSVHWNTFISALKESLPSIDSAYFSVSQHKGKDKHMERVYCYELYHQLRSRLSKIVGFPYILHGEIDKSCNDYVKMALDAGLKPDFIVHDPGEMDAESNLAVFEVKTIYQRYEAKSAIAHLGSFLDNAKYGHAVLLIFGSVDGVDIPANLKVIDNRVTILWHQQHGKIPLQWSGPALWKDE